MDNNTEALGTNTEAINSETSARNRVNAALNGFGSVLGSIIKGAPQQLAPILAATPGMAKFASMMGFAEGYIEVWRGLTTRGVNFSNELDTMITSVGAANLQMQDFEKIVSTQQMALLGLGGTMNSGALKFLQMSQEFEKLDGPFQDLRTNLNLLGMGSVQIAERFAESDTLDAIRNIKEGRTDRQRNIRAAEYAKTLDTLSRLTGKQADALAAEMADISRQGNIFAFGQGISEDANRALAAGMTELSQFGPIVGDMATDLITRGFINADDPNVLALNSASPELRNAFLNARDALKAGEDEVAAGYFQQASAIAADLKNNQQLINLAMLGSATDITRGAQEILTQVNSAGITAAQQAIARGAGDDATYQELVSRRNQLIRDDIAAQLEISSDGNALLESQQEAVRQMQAAAQQLQQTAVSNISAAALASVNALTAEFGGSTAALVTALTKGIDDLVVGGVNVLAGISNGTSDIGSLTRQVAEQVDTLNSLATGADIRNEAANADRLTAQATDLSAMLANYTNDPSATNQQALQQALENASSTITSNRDILVTGNQVFFGEAINDGIKTLFGGAINVLRETLGLEPLDFLATGTMGETGALFKNFGTETIAALHGLEAVVTPSQMHDIVRHSAMGALDASSTVFGQQARFNTSTLDSMLNTIRTMPAQMAQMQTNTGSNELQNTMTQLSTQMKTSLESALNSTLVPSVDKLVTITASHADTSDKIRRGIGDMSNDMLRSV